MGCEGFLPEFPQLARKIFGPLFVHEDHILDDLKKSVILGAIFAFIFREFAQIFRDFAKVFTDFH